MRSRTRTHRLAAAALAALLAFAGSVPLVGAWANGPNNGNGYGTHDWILDQALRVLDDNGIGHGWVNRSIALEATDDPDKVEVAADPSRKIEHTYTATGRRGGAIHRITEHYAKILRPSTRTTTTRRATSSACSRTSGATSPSRTTRIRPPRTSTASIPPTSTSSTT